MTRNSYVDLSIQGMFRKRAQVAECKTRWVQVDEFVNLSLVFFIFFIFINHLSILLFKSELPSLK